MNEGITVRILGDYGPFSSIGKSIGYQVIIGQSMFLLDCGSPLFQQIGGQGLQNTKGLMITHCHDDHKRWFSDLALYTLYTPAFTEKIPLFTTEEVNSALRKGSASALDTSLSPDSKRIIDIPYNEYFDFKLIGPQAKYCILNKLSEDGGSLYYVADREGNTINPDRAKIVIGQAGKPRLLFKDPERDEWIEPESYYGFSSRTFYNSDQNIYQDESGFTIEAIKAPVWHGIPGIGFKFKTAEETLIFSSDTAHDLEIWKQLYTEKRTPLRSLKGQDFESATVLFGDINDFIERTWSEERYHEAINAFSEGVVIHDIADRNSVVHTDYCHLHRTTLRKEKTILTHSPDKLTSEWVLCQAGKYFRIMGNRFYELVGDRLFPMNADIYHKEFGKYYVGFKNPEGKVAVCRNEGLLSLEKSNQSLDGELLYQVDLYEDVEGGYYPDLDSQNTFYEIRRDGRVERVELHDQGSIGTVVESCREDLAGTKS